MKKANITASIAIFALLAVGNLFYLSQVQNGEVNKHTELFNSSGAQIILNVLLLLVVASCALFSRRGESK